MATGKFIEMKMILSLTPVCCMIMMLLQSVASFSIPPSPTPSAKFEFRSFDFDSLTGICRRPASFQFTENDKEEAQYFVLRNVQGDGDCVFQAVLCSVFVSMGMLNPDGTNSRFMSALALEMRNVVANVLSSPDGTLYVNNKPTKRIVRCKDLLQSAAQNEGMTSEEYLTKLRQPGREGGLEGGGPELTVLSNILRRPISIYHLKETQNNTDSQENSRQLERMGVFGEGIFEDPGQSIPDSVISNAVFFTLDSRDMQQNNGSPLLGAPTKCSWHLHVLIADASENEKHACVLLPSVPILHNKSIL